MFRTKLYRTILTIILATVIFFLLFSAILHKESRTGQNERGISTLKIGQKRAQEPAKSRLNEIEPNTNPSENQCEKKEDEPEKPLPPLYPVRIVDYIPLWPQPVSYDYTEKGKTVKYSEIIFKLFDSTKKVHVSLESDDVIFPLTNRYKKLLFEKRRRKGGVPYEVQIRIEDLEDRKLRPEVNEKYSIYADTSGCTISSNNIFGAIRGIETFSQLTIDQTLQLLPISIMDQPRYTWRGFLLDVARHYFHMDTIKRLIDGMAYNKLNFLHLHLVDAQSFPYVVPKFPKLHEKGAYDPVRAIYTPDMLKELVQFAYLRGIRIIPEIDVPGHTYSWGLGYEGITAMCKNKLHNLNFIPLDPSNPKSYEVTKGVIDSLYEIFPDEYYHLGGDEVEFDCWESLPHIKKYMNKEGLSNGKELQGKFMNHVKGFVKKEKKVIVWQELAKEPPAKHKLEKDFLVNVWRETSDILKTLRNGYTIINSAGWYLDRQRPVERGEAKWMWVDVWENMYRVEMEKLVDRKYWGKILGGSGHSWGEQVNDVTVEGRVFPRLSAIAERLWSPKSQNGRSKRKEMRNIGDGNTKLFVDVNSFDGVRERLQHHICEHHLKRGIRASPVRPNFCPVEGFNAG